MKLNEYSCLDATELALLLKRGDVSAIEVAATAASAIDAVNADINAVVETYPDRIAELDEAQLAKGPLYGVPFLCKDNGAYAPGRKRELGSRLCEGFSSDVQSCVMTLFDDAGLNIIGRTNVPEFCIAGTTENALYGKTSNPWNTELAAGGSSGGAAVAVAAGVVPMAHGSDIGGSIRIPASYCGTVGLKPSRGRVSVAPIADEGGYGMAQNFAQTKTIRDTALMLDLVGVPQPGDPFIIRQPARPYTEEVGRASGKLRIAFTADAIGPRKVDGEVSDAVRVIARQLEAMGHDVEEAAPPYDYDEMTTAFLNTWFFGFFQTIDAYGAATGRIPSEENLEHQTWLLYQASKAMDPYDFLKAQTSFNEFRRGFGTFFEDYDIWLTPSTACLPEPLGTYHQGRDDMDAYEYMDFIDRPVQFSTPYNISGCPAISLPLCWSENGIPIGIQLGAKHSEEDKLIRVSAELEEAMPWSGRVPPVYAGR